MINTFYDEDSNSVMTYAAFLSNGNALTAWFVFTPTKKTIAMPQHILYFVTKYLSNCQPKKKNMLELIEKKTRNGEKIGEKKGTRKKRDVYDFMIYFIKYAMKSKNRRTRSIISLMYRKK